MLPSLAGGPLPQNNKSPPPGAPASSLPAPSELALARPLVGPTGFASGLRFVNQSLNQVNHSSNQGAKPSTERHPLTLQVPPASPSPSLSLPESGFDFIPSSLTQRPSVRLQSTSLPPSLPQPPLDAPSPLPVSTSLSHLPLCLHPHFLSPFAASPTSLLHAPSSPSYTHSPSLTKRLLCWLSPRDSQVEAFVSARSLLLSLSSASSHRLEPLSLLSLADPNSPQFWPVLRGHIITPFAWRARARLRSSDLQASLVTSALPAPPLQPQAPLW